MNKYRILVFSDMHGNRGVVDTAKTLVERDGFDTIVFLGDFSDRIGNEESNVADAVYLIDQLSGLAEIKALFGNCDTPLLQRFLENRGVSLHNKLVFKGRAALIGRGGSHPTPFHTPSEFSESEIEKSLEALMEEAADKGAEKVILFTHEPPAGTKADKLPDGHVGSEALRQIIDKYQPNINLCGHIHENKSVDHVKHTKVVNVGPSSKGHFIALEVDGDIETKEINI